MYFHVGLGPAWVDFTLHLKFFLMLHVKWSIFEIVPEVASEIVFEVAFKCALELSFEVAF